MTKKPAQTREQASAEATDWLILLQDDPDDPELRRRFENWLHQSPLNAEAWAVTERTSSLIQTTPSAHAERWGSFLAETQSGASRGDIGHLSSEDPASHPSLSRDPARQPGRARQMRGRRCAVQVAALAIAASLVLAFLPDIVLHIQSDYATGTAETRTIALDDGSVVILAADSAIAVSYDDRLRRVNLLAGEAYFKAAQSPDRPFRVVAGDVRTTVLGTRFDVQRNDAGTTVAVERGVVRVEHPAASPPVSEKLQAGQSVRVSWTGNVDRHDGRAAQVAAWRKGQLIAQDQPMGDVIDQLRRYYGGTIILTSGTLAAQPVTGVYNLSDPVDAVRGVARAHGATVRQVTPWILMVMGR